MSVLDEDVVIGAQVEVAGTPGASDPLRFLLDLEAHPQTLEVQHSSFVHGYSEQVRRLEENRSPLNPGILSLVKSTLANSEAHYRIPIDHAHRLPGTNPAVADALDRIGAHFPEHSGDSPGWISAEAAGLLATLPPGTFVPLLETLNGWMGKASVKAVRARVLTDEEDPAWREVVIEVRLDANTEQALDSWDELEDLTENALQGAPASERATLDRELAIHLLWGADRWDVGPDPTV